MHDDFFSIVWSRDSSFGWPFNYWGSLLVALGYIGMIMLLCQAGWLPKFSSLLAGVGRMALSNYLIQTLICTTLF